jgi:hypothetical protein
MRDMSVAPFGSGLLGPCVVAASRVGNGVQRAGYNFHYCIKTAFELRVDAGVVVVGPAGGSLDH